MLTGSLVAIVTPMQQGGALDLPALKRLIDFQITNGTAGIVIVGTTGESPTVDFDEHCLLIKTAVEHAGHRGGGGGGVVATVLALTAVGRPLIAMLRPNAADFQTTFFSASFAADQAVGGLAPG